MFSKNQGKAEEKKEGVDEIWPSQVKAMEDPHRKKCVYLFFHSLSRSEFILWTFVKGIKAIFEKISSSP